MTGRSAQEYGERRPVHACDALAALGVLRKMLEAVAQNGGASYSTKRKLPYRRAWEDVLTFLQRTPCVAKLARSAVNVLLTTLAEKCNEVHRFTWDPHGRRSVILLQGHTVTALEQAGLLSEAEEVPGSATDLPLPVTQDANENSPDRAQRRAVQRRNQAREPRKQGVTIRVIARTLGCSERALYAYLHDTP